MAKQTINLGTAPTGVGGDTPRSAFTKAQSNFDELYARDAQLGSASNRNVGTAAGELMEKGAFGLGAAQAPSSAFSPVVGFTNHGTSSGESPVPGAGGTRITQNIGGSLYNEIIVTASSIDAPVLAYRQFSSSGSPGLWNTVYTNRNTTRAADGTLKAI